MSITETLRARAAAATAVLALIAASGAPAQNAPDAPDEPPNRADVYDEVSVTQRTLITAQRWPEGQKPIARPMGPNDWALIQDCIDNKHEKSKTPTPFDPLFDPASVQPRGPESFPMAPGNTRADSDFVFFDNNALNDTATGNPGVWPPEPSVGVAGRVVLYCGNTYAALSTDGGSTWTNINPNTEFPAGICCDQVMYYDRRHQLMIWLMQHNVGGNGENIYRIACAVGAQNIANRNWFWYDLSPDGGFGFPAGTWWDFPEMVVTNDYMYFVTNGQDSSDDDAIMVRAKLDELAAGGSTTFEWNHMNTRQIRLIGGASTVMYGAGHVDNNTVTIYRWVDGDGGAFTGVDRDHEFWNNGNSSAPGPDGRDWFSATENSTHKIRGGTATGSTLYFFWTDSQGGGFPFPYVRCAKFSRSDARTYVDTELVWSNTIAWAYAAGHANDRGHLGGVISWGGGDTYHPSSAAWIADDYNSLAIQPLTAVTIQTGDNGPSGDRWGDYLTSRRHVMYGNTWVGCTFTLQNGPSPTDAVNRITWFGRERDRPPTINTIYVDKANTTTWEDGSAAHPYDTVREGHFAAVAGDLIIIRGGSGTYDEQLTLSTPVTIQNENGEASIGQ